MIIYVCYSSKDYELARTLSVELGLLGHDVLFEQKFVGSPVRWHEVFANIESCDLFIFAVSPHSLKSYSCDLEYGYASALNLLILPVIVEAVGVAPRAQQRPMLPYVEWQAQGYSSDAIASALQQLSPHQSYPTIPPLHPDITTPLARLRDEVMALPDSVQAQQFLLDNAIEFLEREDTFANASSVLRLMQTHPRVFPQIAQGIERASIALTKSRAKRSAAQRRAKWVRDIALVLGGALGVLILVRGFLFLRPYLGLDAAQTQEITAEVEPISVLSAPANTETPTAEPTSTLETPSADDLQTQTAIDIQNAVATAAANMQSTATAAIATVFAGISPTGTPEPTLAPSLPPETSAPQAAPTAAAVEYIGMRVEDTNVGVRITEVGQTAADAGVRVDDYVLAVDSTVIHNRVEFLELLSALPPSTSVTFRLRRGASDLYIRIILTPDDFGVASASSATTATAA
jgi:hypothetical protein